MTEARLQLHAGGQACCHILGHQQRGEWHVPPATLTAGLAVLLFLCSFDSAQPTTPQPKILLLFQSSDTEKQPSG